MRQVVLDRFAIPLKDSARFFLYKVVLYPSEVVKAPKNSLTNLNKSSKKEMSNE